ncbi:nitronate monooxygenase [Martelella alba]|uniref:Nitronate monooxygenase n=1 Tax=Martelella alba TaxID=2590451 RepID=A0A506U6W0_9HYPH|nr:nitronate monooxygenase [Martelella alba]TPW29086.1 nitronate monooxygenase [Martelella alba]
MVTLVEFKSRLRLPVIAAPMFLVSGPDLVINACRAGICGTFPALNQRSTAGFAAWLDEIEAGLADQPEAAPFGVNLIVHRSNSRLEADLDEVVRHRVPLVITSLGAARSVVEAVHGYGGLVFHDVISRRHAQKAADAGVDGLIAVSAGAGGHAGTINPFALISEIRAVFSGPIALSGAISSGAQVLAAQAAGADFAYMGTRFIATREALAAEPYKAMLVSAHASDIVYTREISGVNANFLRPSIVAAGLDPDALPPHGAPDIASEAKAWKSVWSAGHGVGAISDIPGVGALVDQLEEDYRATLARLCH